MKIALDYDRTYSADPAFWDQVIYLARLNGHDIRGVTARDDRLDRTAPLVAFEQKVPVIYCRGVAKRWFCTHFADGFIPDIWIDDRPEAIDSNSPADPAGLEGWRIDRNEGPTL